MKTPGITVRPIITMDGGAEVNEVFFDNVKVAGQEPRRRGEQGLDLRQVPARPRAHRHRPRRRLQARAEETQGDRQREREDGQPLARSPRFRDKIAALEVELMALEITNLRMIAGMRGGKGPGPESLDPQDQGHGDPAAHHRADDGGARPLRPAVPARGAGGRLERASRSAPITPRRSRRIISITARRRSMAARTRSSATSSPR